jgi:hypothetical protein
MPCPEHAGGGDEKTLQSRQRTSQGATPQGVEAQRPQWPTTTGAAGTAFQRGSGDHHDAATDAAADQAFAGRISSENGPVTVGHL